MLRLSTFLPEVRRKKERLQEGLISPDQEQKIVLHSLAHQKQFDELLREVTGETQLGLPRPIEQTPIEIAKEEKQKEEVEDSFRLEGERRAFADDESRKIYEASIKQAAGYDIKFQPDEHFKESGLFEKGKQASGVGEEEYTIADEIRDGFSSDEARKAIIYSEILNRRY